SMPSLRAVKRAPGGRSSVEEEEAGCGLVEEGALSSAALALDLDCTSSSPAAGASLPPLPDSAFGASAAAPSSMIASSCWLVTVSPSSNFSSLITPSTVEGTSSTTLSVSRSTMFSSRLTESPTFLYQAAMVASATDSGRTGTLISVAILQLPGSNANEGRGLFGRHALGRVDQGIGDQRGLLFDVVVEVAHRRRGRTGAAGVVQLLAFGQAELQVVLDLVPGALVLRLFLAPDDVGVLAEAGQLGRQQLARERVQLLHADQGDVLVQLLLAALFQQVVVDLARAQHHALALLRLDAGVRDQVQELAVGQLVQGRHGQLVAQQRLGRQHHERLAGGHAQLAADHVERLGRGGGHADHHVVLRAQLQEALKARRAVLRTLALTAVRQEQRQPGQPAPLGFAGGDELVDHHLGAVGEVAELRF